MKNTRNILIIISILIFFLGCKNQNSNQEFSLIKIDDNIIKANPENVKIYFPDGFEIKDLSQKTVINFSSNPEMKKYRLEIKRYQDLNQLLNYYKSSKDYLIVEIKKDESNGYEILKLIQTGTCEKTFSLLIGEKSNLLFSSEECTKDKEEDFKYFDQLILNIRKYDE